MEFRPCIDIHDGKVKQIVGGALDENTAGVTENYVSEKDSTYYALLYKEKGLKGGHVIVLNNPSQPLYEASVEQAVRALEAYPGGLQIGGGVNPQNAIKYLDAGASHVIVTSYVFRDGRVDREALDRMVSTVGADRLVLDLSVRRRGDSYIIVTDRWQKYTEVELNIDTLNDLSGSCDEFLVHGVDVEGRSNGIEAELVGILGSWNKKTITYAGGIHSYDDIYLINALGSGRVNVTVGSSLDIFGGPLDMGHVIEYCSQTI